ncbi:hypothetical protein FOCC_FOCC015081 [Frankliniella occidentalis]|nr:hypothetical protein FOCC_FOCC015081 [Frankliniella occidentalis]
MSDPPKRKRYLGPEEDNLNPQDGDDSTDRRVSILSGDPQSSHHHAEQTPLQSIGCISQQFEEILAGSVSNCPKTTQSRIDPQTLRQTEVPLCSVYTTPSICDNQHQLLGSRSLPEDVVCPEEGAQLISHSQHVLQSTRQADTHLTNISCFRPQPEVSMDSKESLSSPMRTDSSDLAVYSDPILASSDPLVSSDPNVSVDINVSAEIDSCADINRSLEREEAHFPENCSILTRDTRSGFYQKLQFEHNQATGKYSDVYSGELYQNLLKKGSLGRDVLTFQWYTDGAALYSSSNMSVWPVYLTINELPYSERFKKENLLVPLIWCGSVKPRGNLLVDEMYDEMASLRCPGVRLFPFEEDQMIPRTLLKMEEYGEQGTEVKAVKGVKGPCSLSYVMPNYVLGTAIDWMHLVYGGVNKRELLLLLSSKKKAKAWSISKYQTVLNDRLQSIKPPAHIARVPRSLKDIKYWKTSEWKTWLNDYSLPVLEGVLPEIYLRHHGSLVAAAHLLNANEVSSESLTVAENLLKKYVSQFSDFYDPNHMTINIHLLLHLASVVANQGAAWVYTCFPLESLNGVILSLVHGTRWADRQIATSVQTCLALPEIVAKLPESEAKQFCSKVLNRRKYQGAEVVNGSAIIGKSVLLSQENVPPHFVNILEKANIKFQRLKQFHSLKRGHFLYVSLSSKASVCRDSSVAVYNTCNESNVGFIETFLRVYNCECINCSCDSKIIALVKKCEVVKKFKTLIPEVFVPNVAEYKLTEEYEVVCPTNLQGVCVNMKINDKHYISKPTNTMEVE